MMLIDNVVHMVHIRSPIAQFICLCFRVVLMINNWDHGDKCSFGKNNNSISPTPVHHMSKV